MLVISVTVLLGFPMSTGSGVAFPALLAAGSNLFRSSLTYYIPVRRNDGSIAPSFFLGTKSQRTPSKGKQNNISNDNDHKSTTRKRETTGLSSEMLAPDQASEVRLERRASCFWATHDRTWNKKCLMSKQQKHLRNTGRYAQGKDEEDMRAAVKAPKSSP